MITVLDILVHLPKRLVPVLRVEPGISYLRFPEMQSGMDNLFRAFHVQVVLAMLPLFAGIVALVAEESNEAVRIPLLRGAKIENLQIEVRNPVLLGGTRYILFPEDVLAHDVELTILALARL